MNTIQFFNALLNWLLADPVHLTFAAGAIAALTPTPNPTTVQGKLYRIIDILALNVLHAKDTGHVNDPAVAKQVAALLEQFQQKQQPTIVVNSQEQSK